MKGLQRTRGIDPPRRLDTDDGRAEIGEYPGVAGPAITQVKSRILTSASGSCCAIR